MNLLLIAVNSKYIHSSLSIWYLSASLKSHCTDAIKSEVLECTINQPIEPILHAICEKKPDAIAFSCYIWNITFMKELIRRIAQALPKTSMILGGPEVSYRPEQVLADNPDVDYIITGEGEVPFPALINYLQSGENTRNIPGLCFRDNGTAVCNSPGEPMREPPAPYTAKYFDSLTGRIAYLETSRGCPYFCAFCLSGLNGCRVRFFDMERAKNELLLLANSGTQTIKLVDRTFNCNPGRAYELFDFIIRNSGNSIPAGICFHFEVSADLFDDKTLDLLAKAPPGLIQMEAGLQSFNAETLSAISRKTDLNKLEATLRRILQNQNIHLHIDLIAGLPYENLDSFADSFDRAYRLSPHMLQLGFLKMLHGSDLRKKAAELGIRYSPLPPYEVNSTPWLSETDLNTLKQTEYALQRLFNSGRFLFTLDYLLNATGMRPFSLFEGLGAALAGHTAPLSLDDFTLAAYNYFNGLAGVHSAALRDAMVCDRIATGNKIPDLLKVPDKNYKTILNHIRKAFFPEQKNGKLNTAVLYTGGNRAVFASGEKNPVTGRHPLKTIPLKEYDLKSNQFF